MSQLRRARLVVGYYLSWLLFGAGGLALNTVCVPLLFFPRRERFGPWARRATQWMFGRWQDWMDFSGVIEVSFVGFDRLLPRGTVYVANHPSLADALFLLGCLPDTVCILKPSLLRNPFIAPAAIISGYVSGDAGVDGIRSAVNRVATGCSLLVFPEGTRTDPGISLNRLHPGFTLIARRARAPIQLIHVRASPAMGRKDNPWWKLPPLPGRFEFTLGELITADHPASNAALADHVANCLRV